MRARMGKRPPEAIVEPGRVLHELRLVKTTDELAKLRRAAEITAEAHMAAMRDGLPGRRENQVQAEIEYAFRRRGGSGPGYGTIVAGGANSTILHYRAGDAVLKDGDVCLVDAGRRVRLVHRRRDAGRSRSPASSPSRSRRSTRCASTCRSAPSRR